MKKQLFVLSCCTGSPPLLAAAQAGLGSVERGLFIVELKTYFETYNIVFSQANMYLINFSCIHTVQT